VAERGRFCAECGGALDAPAGGALPAATLVPPVSERRVTSVLFGDLVGFTPLSESRDAEEVRELLSRYFEECRVVIGRYGGVVEKFIGDAVMAVWGVPVAHEDDAERAVRAGLELVQVVSAMGEDVGAPGLAMRVGVVTGEVAVTVGATAEGMVAGDAVNTAARVQSAAEPGTVWVDDVTRSLTAAAIAFSDAGEHALKGKAQPVRLWRARDVVAEVGGGQRVDGLEAPLTGRSRELRLLKELFHATAESGRPRLVVIDGDAGIGKSRLMWELEKYIDGLTATTRWHRGRCLSYGDGVAFWALAEAVRTRLGLADGDTGSVVGERLDGALMEFVSSADERDWLRPRLATLVGEATSVGTAREDLFAAWATFLERLSEGGNPVVLVIDDAQYADDGLLDFLDHMLAAARAPIFVVALARPELLGRRPTLGGRRATVVRLDALDDAAMAELVDGLVVGLPDDARAALVARSEGVPLFAVETVRALIDRDAIVPKGGQYVPAPDATLDLTAIGAPASLQALVAARLDALSVEERRVVADASVLGESFTREGLVALGGDPGDLETSLASLQRKEIVAVQQDRFSAERGQYRFVQSVVRQVAYGTLSKRDRKTKHQAAAEFLGSEPDPGDDLTLVVAQHLLDAADAAASGDPDVADLIERACARLERAAVRANALGAPAEALRLFETAIERTVDARTLGHLHLKASRAARDTVELMVALEHSRAASRIFDDLGLEAEAAEAVAAEAATLMNQQDNTRALELAGARWKRLEGRSDCDRAKLQLCRVMCVALSSFGDWEAMTPFADRQIVLAEALDDHPTLISGHINLGIRYLALRAPLTAQAMYESAARLGRELDVAHGLSMALNNMATMAVSRDLGLALDYGRQGIEAAHRSGVVSQVDFTRFNYLLALWVAGRLAEASELLQDLEETVADPAIIVSLPAVEAWLADAHGLPAPELDSVVDSDNQSDQAWQSSYQIARAVSAGEIELAALLAEESLAPLLAVSGLDDDFLVLWPPIVQAALEAGDVARVERVLAPVEEAAATVVSPAVAAQHLRLRGLQRALRGDEPELVEADLRAAVTALTGFGAVGWAARAEQDLARWLTEQGRASEAQEFVDRARTTYLEIGAHGWLEKLDAQFPARVPHVI
jgi:class 3 adenylate cyclase